MKRVLVFGAGGFIGSHLVERLKQDGFWVRGVDRKPPEFSQSQADEFVLGDLRDPRFCAHVVDGPFDEVFQLAAEMGGAEFTFAGVNDANILSRSALININVLESSTRSSVRRIFFASSACVYPARNQMDPGQPNCAEHTVYPADPDSEYGWEKLFAERLYLARARCGGPEARIARFHNVFGPKGTWRGGREKAPAALCRKIAAAEDGDEITIFGDGEQSRSFLYISEAIEGTMRLMRSEIAEPINIGSDQLVTINQMANMLMAIAGKTLTKTYISGPTGVRGRNSDNSLIETLLNWRPSRPLSEGLEQTYRWVEKQVRASDRAKTNKA
jgi:nucleoside-diphosphate-sugar epimerase